MRCPLAVLGATLELARLSMCSPIIWTKCGPAAQMSAPESGRTSNPAWPLREVTVARIMGAGLDERFDNCECCSRRPYVRGFRSLFLACRHTQPKWPVFPHLWHVLCCAGQCLRPPSCCLPPQPMQSWVMGSCVFPTEAAFISCAPVMSARDFLAASRPRHLEIAASSVRSWT